MSLTRICLYIPIQDGLRLLIIVAVLTLFRLLGQNLYFPLLIPLGMLFRALLDPLQCHLKITSNRNVEIEQAGS